jgi:hypothetical protein
MSNDAFMILLAVGVPAVAITGLALAICATSGRCSRKEEQELDMACYAALEGDLRNFNPVIDPPPSN